MSENNKPFIVRQIRHEDTLLNEGAFCQHIHRKYILGNPFLLDDPSDNKKRELVIREYKQWLWSNLSTAKKEVIIPCKNTTVNTVSVRTLPNSLEIKQAIYNLLLTHIKNPTQQIALICYCYPKPCHGDAIVTCLNWLLQPTLIKIISGGQTGADYAGLIAASKLGIETGGTAPKNYRICLPDGADSTNPQLKSFGLVESDSYNYKPRTIQNVLDSDGTVWFGYPDSPGGTVTRYSCVKHNKPYVVNPNSLDLFFWVKTRNIKILNVAGNRVSNFNPNIAEQTEATIRTAFEYCR